MEGEFGTIQIAQIGLKTHKVDENQDEKDVELALVVRNTGDIPMDVGKYLKFTDTYFKNTHIGEQYFDEQKDAKEWKHKAELAY